MKKAFYLIIFLLFSVLALGQNTIPPEPDLSYGQAIDQWFGPKVDYMASVLFWDPFKSLGVDFGVQIPFVVLWLLFGAVYFTVKMHFINFKGFKHGIDLIRGKFDNPTDRGEVSHFQALTAALSATVGLGNIAGVAIAISMGGPGASFWMIVAGFLGMASKFVEVTLGVKYRVIDEHGVVSGGPMYYLSRGLKQKKLGKVLAVLFAILAVGGSLGGGNMFQANQAFGQVVGIFPSLEGYGFVFGLLLAVVVGIVIVGGIKSIAKVTERIVPFMAALYLVVSLIIIGINIEKVGDVVLLIFNGAFAPDAIKGGGVGVLVIGIKRAAFSNEAGIGSASIAHSAVKTEEPVSEGVVALLEPFIDTVVICTLTAFVLIFTGFHEATDGLQGAQLTSAAFESVFWWFPYLLVVAILLFAFSTMISWSYYGLKSFDFLVKGWIKNKKTISYIYHAIFLAFVVVGSSSSLGSVMDFSDMMVLCMAFPNILGLFLLASEVKKDFKSYFDRVKSGEIKKYK